MKLKLITLCAPAVIIFGMTAQVIQSKQFKENGMKKKDQVVALLKSIESGDSAPVAFINTESYKQHNLAIKDGIAGFAEVLSALPKGSAKVNTVRVFEDGDFVFTHSDYNFFGPKIGFDIFRFDNGKIVEHWDNLQEKPESSNPSGRTMIDGSNEIKDLEFTDKNKLLVEGFVRDVLMGENPSKLASYFEGDNYIQHNPSIADGLSGLGKALSEMAKSNITMEYSSLEKILGEGNFVLTVSSGRFAGKIVTYYDLFRVENGKIAEHWDVIEPMIPEGEWKNENGKFGF